MSEGSASRQSARLFLEGREVPFISAVIQSEIGSPSTAQIDLVPLQNIKFIRPKTQVHIFVKDPNVFGDDDFYLAWEGEVSGRAYSKRQDYRSTRITAMDYSTYLEDAKAYFLSPNHAVGKVAETAQNGEISIGDITKAAAGKSVGVDSTSESYFIRVLTSKKDADGNVDLVKGIVEIIRQLGTVNEFYRAAYERLRILERFRSYNFSKLGTFLRGIKTDIFFSNFTGANGGLESIRVVLNRILSFVFHEVVSLPFPGKGLDDSGASLAQFLIIPDSYSLPPPKCNVLFPSQIIGFGFYDDFRAQPTRYIFKPSFVMPAKDETRTMKLPMQAYPTSFSDYMFGSKTVTQAEGQGLLGPSSILKSKDGRVYSDLKYGKPSKGAAVGSSVAPTLREADFLTNEESIRGIFLDLDNFSPNYTAWQRAAAPGTRNTFFKSVGEYMFFKKRFGSRQCSAEIVFNPNIVLGLNALFIDDSDAGQSFIAKVQGITHTLSNYGFTTQLNLAYGRDFDEVDALSGALGDPPIPPWLDPDVFGKKDMADFRAETNFLFTSGAISQEEKEQRERLISGSPAQNGRGKVDPQVPQSYKNLSEYYLHLIGCESITEFKESTGPSGKKITTALATSRGAVSYLLQRFKNTKIGHSRDKFVRDYNLRLFIRLREAMAYIGASTNSYDEKGSLAVPEEFAEFSADKNVTGSLSGRFDGKGFSDENILLVRREIIDAYVDALKSGRSFRG